MELYRITTRLIYFGGVDENTSTIKLHPGTQLYFEESKSLMIGRNATEWGSRG